MNDCMASLLEPGLFVCVPSIFRVFLVALEGHNASEGGRVSEAVNVGLLLENLFIIAEIKVELV